MAQDLTFGIRLKADGSGLVGEVRVSAAALEKLGDKGARAGQKLDSIGVRLARRLKTLGPQIRRLGRTLSLSMTAPVAGLGTAIFRTGSQFGESLAKIEGLVGQSREQIDAYRQDILKLGPAVGKGPGELADALFFVTSAGFEGQAALDVLRLSAQGAASGLGDTATVADAVTSAINAFGAANLSAERATGILVATVRAGKAEADSIAGALGAVLPIASELGVGFDQVGAAIAAMTKLGLDAPEAATALRGTLAALLRPGEQAAKTLQMFGLSTQGIQRQLREEGLIATLFSLRDAFGDNKEALTKIFPDIRGLTGVLNLVGENAEVTKNIFAQLADAGAKDLEKAFGAQSQESALKFKQLTAQVSVALIELGEAVLPVLIPLIESLTSLIARGADAFTALDPGIQQIIVVVAGAAAAIGPFLIALGFVVPAITAIAGAIAALVVATGPFGLLIAGLIALRVAWGIWGDDITRFVIDTVSVIRTWLVDTLGAIFAFVGERIDAVVGFFGNMKDAVTGIVSGMVGAIRTWLVDRFGGIVDAIKEKIDFVKNIWSGLSDFLVGNSVVPDMIDAIGEQFGRLDGVMVAPAMGAAEAVTRGMRDMADAAGAAITRLVTEGKLSFQSLADVARSTIDDILNQLLTTFVTNPIVNAATSGLTSLIGGLFGTGVETVVGNPVAGASFTQFSSGRTVGGLATGGIVGGKTRTSHVVDPAAFIGAPHFAGGGVLGGNNLGAGAVPAVLHRGEGVFTPEQMAALAPVGRAAQPNINIQIDARGAERGVELRIAQAMDEAVRRAMAAIQASAQRGGAFARLPSV